ncbi:SDR family oxidoreductase [Nocardioides anomalus]|uniref:SDR family oxidoreductase n=1 Tax=Nocardioides anomalus TaxID=2712223 RepID=A0A6G6WD10_9ACTN|nr:SDR family NAD(P)-dependent oxidoreductase [Nocardioides anomalus]QIG43037.1 SDR family oxidoreductase [Nocardioides anomalus]
MSTPVAVITGVSQGLGRALAHELAGRGWALVLDARHERALHDAVRALPGGPHPAIAGDVADPAHRRDLVDVAAELGGATALVNNASTLGLSPLPPLAELDPATYVRLLEVNLVAPVVLTAALLPQLRRRSGVVVNLSSDAAVEAYGTWGGYGSSKAALDHASRVLAAEEPVLRVYAVDPGDMRTQLHQDAFPGEDVSDRPEPETVVPALLRLLEGTLPSGRYRAAELAAVPA